MDSSSEVSEEKENNPQYNEWFSFSIEYELGHTAY